MDWELLDPQQHQQRQQQQQAHMTKTRQQQQQQLALQKQQQQQQPVSYFAGDELDSDGTLNEGYGKGSGVARRTVAGGRGNFDTYLQYDTDTER